ncbi:MAG: TonB-dependent receptor plug domain-containing protein [Gammaproteobacteria bacterium]|nr:TonB-dependent receptor plug domain-containing protein [Gammaproteobacteria bacterium]
MRKHIFYMVLAYTATGLLFSGYGAQQCLAEESTLTEQHYFPDIPIVLSATRMPQSVEDAPVAVTIITRDMIEASGATEIPDVFRLVPGFLVDYDNAHVPAVSYHMLPDRYVRQQQVLIDGRSVYDPLIGGVHWMELPITIDDIERIEVIRGANAATYGSNSFMGVINIITRSAILDKGTTVKTNVGSEHLREGFLRYGDSNGALDYRINLAYRSDDGFRGRHDGKIIRLINSRVDYQVNDRDNLMMQAGYSEGPRQMDDVIDTSIPNYDMNTFSQFQQIKWQRIYAPEDEYSLQFYHNQLGTIDTYVRTDYPVYWDGNTNTERYDLEFQKIKRISPKLRYVVGASLRRDQVSSQLYFNTPDTLSNDIRRLFAHGEYHYNRDMLFNLGAMLEDNDITGSNISPRASINYKLTPKDTVRVSISKADRTPVLLEQYPDMVVSVPSLGFYDQVIYNGSTVQNEKITEYEIGFIGQKLRDHLKYDVKFFYQDIDGLINALNSPVPASIPDTVDGKAYVFNNYDSADIRGLETGIDWDISRATKIHVAFSSIHISSTDNREDYSKSAPATMLSLLAMHNFSHGYSGSVFIYSRGKMKPLVRHANDPEYMDPYTRVDVRLAKSFKSGNTSQKIAVVARNIFNAHQDTLLLNNVARGAYISYQIGFN